MCKPALFVKQLWKILQDSKNHTTIRWIKNGKGFVILDRENLEETILPLYFRHNKFSSFQRQLNYYGFKKCFTKNKLETIFWNPFFQREHPEKCYDIIRKTDFSRIKKMENEKKTGDVHLQLLANTALTQVCTTRVYTQQ